MAHTYTPGLRVSALTRLVKERRLPLPGEVLVSKGERVSRDQVVAQTELPGDVVTMNLVNRLGVTAEELPRYMIKKEGEPISAGEALAETHPLIKWFKTVINSEVDGVVESISSVTGQVILRRPPTPVEVTAYVDGVVVEVLADGIKVEVEGALVQGIFGIGGECWGALHMVAANRNEDLLPDQIDAGCSGKILVGGALVTSEAIAKAAQVGAVAVIGGGIRDSDLHHLLGYDLGVAITGSEKIGVTVVITEGFGKMSMAPRTFDILSSCSGRMASVSGATQIRAGVLRPEIVVAADNGDRAAVDSTAFMHNNPGESHQGGLTLGDPLRVIRAPHFGRIGQVDELIADLQQIETEAKVRVLQVKFDDGSTAVIPRANVELIEQ